MADRQRLQQLPSLVKWACSISFIAVLVGSTSALFLVLLNFVGRFRELHPYVLYGLPLAGVFIVWFYQRYAGLAQKGNNLILEEYYHPNRLIPLRMAPMVFLATLITHLFGGSAGREGTAIQYSAAITDQLNRIFSFDKNERRILLICAVAAGFASLFGTPIAGLVFGLELFRIGKIRWKAILPTALVAFAAHAVCLAWGTPHTMYPKLLDLPALSTYNLGWLALSAGIFALAAIFFLKISDLFNYLFKLIKQPLVRPFIGGLLLILAVQLIGSSRHIGLGLDTIQAAFTTNLDSSDFLVKTILTALTLSAGFKGGEVTPLFFIGATLGNALSLFIPLPMALLAAMGFVAVFAGCTKTPLACSIMGLELFGMEAFVWLTVACFISYMLCRNFQLYSAQKRPYSVKKTTKRSSPSTTD